MRVGIVEDELLVAESIREMLLESGYEVSEPAISYSHAIRMIEDFNPELLLLDIQLSGNKDGVDLAMTLRTTHNLPIIFLTANSDKATLERVKSVKPNAYLVKPFHQEELFAAIEIAFSNFTEQNREELANTSSPFTNVIAIKQGNVTEKFYVHEILYMLAEHVYVTIFLSNGRKLTVRSGLKDYLQTFDPEVFFMVHRSYAVNLRFVHKMEGNDILMGQTRIPVARAQKDELLKRIGKQQKP
jgi:DNA-binding LytR/AlgR family response regulator